jgi:hypothetical protein
MLQLPSGDTRTDALVMFGLSWTIIFRLAICLRKGESNWKILFLMHSKDSKSKGILSSRMLCLSDVKTSTEN